MVRARRVVRPENRIRPLPERIQPAAEDEFLGERIRELRKARDITLAELAEATGLSVGYLSQVERDISDPSIKALHDIAAALGVNISWFFDASSPEHIEERDYVVRAGRRRRLTFSSGITDELLSPHLRGQLELLCSRFEPGSYSGDEPYTHRGEEAGIVISGTLEIWIGSRHFMLEAGDSFSFPSTVPHRYRNPGQVEAIVIWAITPPSY